jgi:pSer/pThr/pTyr-binding forkhead associated (FHA) protein
MIHRWLVVAILILTLLPLVALAKVKCPKCGHNNLDDAKFCESCGEPLALPEMKPWLVTDTSGLIIRTTPPGAQVTLDGALNYSTPCTLRSLTPATHTLKLTLQGYKELTDTFTVTRLDREVRIAMKTLSPTPLSIPIPTPSADTTKTNPAKSEPHQWVTARGRIHWGFTGVAAFIGFWIGFLFYLIDRRRLVASAGEAGSLVIMSEGKVLSQTNIHKSELALGSDPSNDVHLPSPEVSPRHALIKRKGKRFVLYDLYTPQGIFVNTRKVLKRALENKDNIQIGPFELLFLNTFRPIEVRTSPEGYKDIENKYNILLSEKESFLKDLSELRLENESLLNNYAALQIEAKTKGQENETLSAELEKIELKISDLETERQEQDKLLQELTKQTEELRDREADLKNLKENAAGLTQRITCVAQEKGELERKYRQATNHLEARTEEVAELNKRITTLSKEKDEALKRAKDAVSRWESQSKEVADLKKDLAEAESGPIEGAPQKRAKPLWGTLKVAGALCIGLLAGGVFVKTTIRPVQTSPEVKPNVFSSSGNKDTLGGKAPNQPETTAVATTLPKRDTTLNTGQPLSFAIPKTQKQSPALAVKPIEKKQKTVSSPLKPGEMGTVNVSSIPVGATIYVDGKPCGTTPKAGIPALVGAHRVRLISPDGKKFETSVKVENAQKPARVSHTFE